MCEIKTGWSPEERRLPSQRPQSSNNALTVLLFVVLGLQGVTVGFLLVWEARYQRAVDAVERAVEQLEAIEF